MNLFTFLIPMLRKHGLEQPIVGSRSADFYAGKVNEILREAMRDGVTPHELIRAMEDEALESGDAMQTQPNHRKGGE